MTLPGSSYVLLLGTIFLSSVFFLQDAFSGEESASTNAAFDTTEREAEQLSMGAPSNSLYGSACQICHSIFDLVFSKRCLEKLDAIGTELLVTIIVFLIFRLLMRHIKNTKPSQDMNKIVIASDPNNDSTQKNQEMLEQLVKNTHNIKKTMKLYVMGHYRKETESKLRRRRKNYETESEWFLPVCSCHDSGQDSA
ncbi:uncharacterized protein LOC134296785 [Anolis carolinensis]|uniref:uncharacterized protein LOC134296785 n=1 Tax=Anolis carolinensis TaxID=28377 RepID=UPI002F2B775E